MTKKTAKRVVSVAKGRTYEDLYQRLSTKEGEKDIYRMARAIGRQGTSTKLCALRMKGIISW